MMPAGNGLAARYYANTTFADGPVETAYDRLPSTAQMAERWHGRPPQVFGVVWTGYISAPRADQYRFATTSDDGSRLFVDDRLVVDNGGPHSRATQSGTITLSRGSHRVRLEYTQFGGGSELAWLWTRGNAPLAPVPTWALSRRAVASGTATAARFAEVGVPALASVAALALVWCAVVTFPAIAAAYATAIRDRDANAAWMALSAGMVAAVLLMPWPDGRGAPFYKSIALTVGDLAHAIRVVGDDPGTFQANLVRPLAGEEAIGPAAQQATALLRAHGVEQYELSNGLARDDWAYQQIVAAGWPSRRVADAHLRVALNTEPTTGCATVERQRDVSLVYCP
jgi:hypothetical protein